MISKKCKNCNVFFNTKRSAKQYCSDKCFAEYRSKPENKEKTNIRRKEYNLKKYGIDNPAKLESTKNKTKKTCIERYGTQSPSQNKEIKEKQIETCIRKYGVNNPLQDTNIRKRQQQSLYSNYGVVVPLKNEKIYQRVRFTNLKRYGVDNPAKTDESKHKTINTNLQKYGVSFVSQHSEFKIKQIKARLRSHYNFLINSSKFINIVPLFTENEYIGNISYDTQYPFKCKICNSQFNDTLLSGNIPRCFSCNPINRTQTESEITDFIRSIIHPNVLISNDRKILGGKELDIYIPSSSLSIEYNGLYWHSEIGGKKYKNYHINKTENCLLKNVRLIHIFEDEWIFKRNIVENKLIHILNKNNNPKVYARKCIISNISSKICNDFLEKNHIQGADNSSLRLGAFYNNELVSVMTFGSLRVIMGSTPTIDKWEMYRFCTDINKRIIGIGSKIFKYFVENYHPKHVVSYSDCRWSIESDKGLYRTLGFKFSHKTPPNYWYLSKNYNKRMYRFGFRKRVLSTLLPNFNPMFTEWKNMQLNGYDRIWDCGNFKYEWSC